jgi:hypothetical protein
MRLLVAIPPLLLTGCGTVKKAVESVFHTEANRAIVKASEAVEIAAPSANANPLAWLAYVGAGCIISGVLFFVLSRKGLGLNLIVSGACMMLSVSILESYMLHLLIVMGILLSGYGGYLLGEAKPQKPFKII